MFMSNVGELRVTAADLVRQFGKWQDRAAVRPIFITHHGRDRFVLQSAASYAALRVRSVPDAGVVPAQQTLIEQMREGFVAFDADLAIVAINSAAAALLQVSREGAVGRKLFARDAMRESLLYAQLDRSLRSGALGAFDAPSPAFADRWLGVRTFPYGEGVACLLNDITETVVTRRESSEAAATLGALAAQGRAARAHVSPRGTFATVDPLFAELTGLSTEALAGARLVDVLPLARRRVAGEAIEAVLSGGAARALDTALLRNGGEELPVRLALAGYVEDHGPGGAIALVIAA